MTNHIINFYHFPLSPPSRAALLLVKTLGIRYNLKIINIINGEQNNPNYLKMNPFHTVPTLDDQGFYVYDSAIIMKYLSKKYAKDDSLYPMDPRKAAIVDERMYFANNYLLATLRDYFGPVMFENKQPSTEKAKNFEENLRILNNFLDHETWVAGKNLTIADFSIISVISTAEAIMFYIHKYENILSWYERAKKTMTAFGYLEVIQFESDQFGEMFKKKLKEIVG